MKAYLCFPLLWPLLYPSTQESAWHKEGSAVIHRMDTRAFPGLGQGPSMVQVTQFLLFAVLVLR
jgi:hypothetical protein